MSKPTFSRILLKLSGEIFAGELGYGIDPEITKKLAQKIIQISAKNIQKIQNLLESITGSDLFAAEIYFLSKLPAKIDFYEVSLVVLFALALSLLATLYPAWRASRVDPIKVLRHA